MKKNANPSWMTAALDYIPKWLDFQVERYRQPGCAVAIVHRDKLIGEFGIGVADMRTDKPMTPRHRFRIASHSKTFTASGVMLLREHGKLGLDDPIGRYVSGLHKDLAKARVSELLSHGAGVVRDGADAGQFLDRRPYLSRAELLQELANKQPLEPGLQLKYSNHGYGLLGLMIEEISGVAYTDWITRHVIDAAGLKETAPDMPQVPKSAPMASGHTTEFPFGQRLIVPGDNPCNAIAPAGGFVSTASDVARFFAQLAPESKKSILTPASRREMMHRRWRDECNTMEFHYGYGTMMNERGPKEWFGHTGSLQGIISRTARFPATGFTITVLTNAIDGLAYAWVDGVASVLAAFNSHGAPAKALQDWDGRWWSMWGTTDLVAMGKVVCQIAPAMLTPFDHATTEFSITGKDDGIITKTSAFNSPGQTVRRVRNGKGRATELWMGGTKLLTKEAMVAEVTGRYRKSGKTRP